MVLQQIQDLLHEHDCVIIPDFGGLIAQYASVKIHPVKHTFSPPSKRIAFNEKLKHSDGLLINSLSRHLQIPNPEAQKMVAEFVGNLQKDLSQHKQTELQGIGIFRYNVEQKLEFEYLEADNYLSHSFGLPELVSRPIVPEEAAALRAVRQKIQEVKAPASKKGFKARSMKLATIAATVLTGGMTIAMVYYVSLQTDYNLSSLNPVSLFQQGSEKMVDLTAKKPEADQTDAFETLTITPEEESVSALEADLTEENFAEAAFETETGLAEFTSELPAAAAPENAREIAAKTAVPAAKTEEVSVKKAAADKVEITKTVGKTVEKVTSEKEVKTIAGGRTINAETGRYFVISGGFSTMANAERSKKDLTASGAQSNIILPMKGSKLFRVSVAEFESMEMATAKLPELRKQYGNSLWIFNY